ncbi:unnamed protein product [Cyclocybe aegerita]|uniref:Uncharacterized protein n=1 Tax=Cyclocybe aegerita TaxID=1973307 RepID=A0A8S0VVU1_CYCAE|nr:unnamed protein product [Cyclocybe aegerita]
MTPGQDSWALWCTRRWYRERERAGHGGAYPYGAGDGFADVLAAEEQSLFKYGKLNINARTKIPFIGCIHFKFAEAASFVRVVEIGIRAALGDLDVNIRNLNFLNGKASRKLPFAICVYDLIGYMGTRGLLGYIIGAVRHAAYNQYDSYPGGLGHGIIEFILSLNGPDDYEKMDSLVRKITWVDKKSTPSPELQRKYSEMGFSDWDVYGRPDQHLDWHTLLHGIQGAIALSAIQSGNLEHLVESTSFLVDFLKDGLFCEWAYFIDFKNQKLETWTDGRKWRETTFQVILERRHTANYWDKDDDDKGSENK